MTAERCPRCDRSRGDASRYRKTAFAKADECWHDVGGGQAKKECLARAVDWRARALAAEEKADAYQRDWYGAKAEFGAARARLRADAAREERERVVTWLRAVDKNGRRDGSDTVAALFHDAADAIATGDHAKGGR